MLCHACGRCGVDKWKNIENYKIPTLEEVLYKFPELSFQIDFKTDEVVNPALEVISKSNASERVCVASFNSERLNNVRSTHPHLCISMGPNEVAKTLMSSFGIYRGIVPGDCLQIPIRYYGVRIVTKRFVNYLKSKGIKIMVWTINDVKTFNTFMNKFLYKNLYFLFQVI